NTGSNPVGDATVSAEIAAVRERSQLRSNCDARLSPRSHRWKCDKTRALSILPSLGKLVRPSKWPGRDTLAFAIEDLGTEDRGGYSACTTPASLTRKNSWKRPSPR